MTAELRAIKDVAVTRAAATGGRILTGYALKYSTLSQNLGGFVETIAPGAVDELTLQGARNDVVARYQHEDHYLLGRLASGTLRLSSDGTGVIYDVDLPDTDYANNVATLAERGDLRYSSFAFEVLADEWSQTEQGFPLRILRSIKLVDVAPVVTPAYMDTSTGLRRLAEARGLPVEDVLTAANESRLGAIIAPPEAPAPQGEETPASVQGETQTAKRKGDGKLAAWLLKQKP